MAFGKVKGRVISKSKRRPVMAKLASNVQRELNAMAREGAEMCATTVSSGNAGIQTDTGALEAAFYVATPRGNGYSYAVSRAASKYIHKYSQSHFEGNIAPPLKVKKLQAGYGNAMMYMAYWEYGHMNYFTGMQEKVPIMRPVRDALRAKVKSRFKNVMKGGDAGAETLSD